MIIQVHFGCQIGTRELAVLRELRQRSRTRLVQHDRFDHSKLDSQQKDQKPNHKVAVAIKVHSVCLSTKIEVPHPLSIAGLARMSRNHDIWFATVAMEIVTRV